MRHHAGTAYQLSPIARQQRQLASLGYLGAAGASVYSGPPVGVGAGKGAEIGAAQGASLGTTIMPGIGTAIGAVIGAIGGAIAGAIGKQDPEINNFNAALALWQQQPDAIYKLANKYMALAGFFDLTPQQAGRIRIYRKYGRMGEEAFTRDLTAQVYQAAQAGVIKPSDSAVSVYQKIILPWEDSWGFGPEPSNPHSDFMDRLLTGLIFDYVTGYGPSHWYSRSGPLPASFSSIPPFQFPGTISATASTATVAQPPTPGASLQQPTAPTTVLGTDGSTVTSPGTALRNASGQLLYFGAQRSGDPNNVHGYPVWVNGAQNGYLLRMLLANSGQVYGQNDTNWFQWNGSGWGVVSGPPGSSGASAGPQQPVAPVTVLSSDGATVTAPGTALKNSSGQLLYFGNQGSGDPNNVHGYPVWVNGTQNGYLLGMLLAGGQVYGQNDTNWFQWSGSGWNVLPGAPQFGSPTASNTLSAPATSSVASVSTTPVVSTPVTSVPAPTAVSVPVGFTLVGTANGLQAYLGPDGLYYSWSGASMSPLTGTLVGLNGTAANVISGQVQTSQALSSTPATSTPQSAPSVYTPPPDYSSYQPPVAAPQQSLAPASSSGIPTWAWLGAGLGALYLLSGRRRHA